MQGVSTTEASKNWLAGRLWFQFSYIPGGLHFLL